MMVIQNEFEIGQIVYLRTDLEQLPRLITGIRIRPGNTLVYDLGHETKESVHYELEIRADEDIVLKTTN